MFKSCAARSHLSTAAMTDAKAALESKGIYIDRTTGSAAGNNANGVSIVEVTGADGFGARGMNLVLEGPAALEAEAVAAAEAMESVDTVTYNVIAAAPPPPPPPAPEPEPTPEPAPEPEPEPAEVAATIDLNRLFELEPIQFATASANIRAASFPTLDEAARILEEYPSVKLLVVGHTDSDGGAAGNLTLSQARADAVVSYLVGTKGIDSSRLTSEGRGETELLISPETSAADKQRNRRIAWERIQ